MNVMIERRVENGWRDEGQSGLFNFLEARGFDFVRRQQIQHEMLLMQRYEDDQWRLRRAEA